MRFIIEVCKKFKDVLLYLIFGVLTTLVNFLVYFPLYNWFNWPASICNIIAWLFAVVFAYITNKPFVFKSNDWTMATVFPEAVKFVSCRIGSGLLETLVIWFFVDLKTYNGNWVKIIVSILVVILNYVASKWFVFTKREKG